MTTDTQERTNGHHPKGRAAPPLPAFTFPDSGVTVGLRRFAPDTQDQIARAIQRENPPPQVPVVETELGDEPNPADPDYQKAVSEYMQRLAIEVSTKMVDLALRRMDVEVDQAAVDALRADMAAIGTPIEDADDRMVYIRHICISSTYDLTSMLAYLQRRSLPTEVAVQEFNGRDIFSIRVPRAGISYSREFEWREAAHWARYQWEDFSELDGDEQAAIVAHYRAHLRIEAVIAQDMERRRGD